MLETAGNTALQGTSQAAQPKPVPTPTPEPTRTIPNTNPAANDPVFKPKAGGKGIAIGGGPVAAAAMIANALLPTFQERMQKRREECAELLKDFKLHRHGSKRNPQNKFEGVTTASHHILQNAFLQPNADRDATPEVPSKVCTGNSDGKPGSIATAYKESDGLCLPLEKSDHKIITDMQRVFAKTQNPPIKFDPTVSDEIDLELQQVTKPRKLDPYERECVLFLIRDQLKRQCPDVHSGKTSLLKPGI